MKKCIWCGNYQTICKCFENNVLLNKEYQKIMKKIWSKEPKPKCEHTEVYEGDCFHGEHHAYKLCGELVCFDKQVNKNTELFKEFKGGLQSDACSKGGTCIAMVTDYHEYIVYDHLGRVAKREKTNCKYRCQKCLREMEVGV